MRIEKNDQEQGAASGHPFLAEHHYGEMMRIARSCYCAENIIKPSGVSRFGFFNFKRIYGTPTVFRQLIDILAPLIVGDALCAADTGVAPLVGAISLATQTPAIYIRSTPKNYYLSYGSRSVHNHPWVFGERLSPGMSIQVIDDVFHTGKTVIEALRLLSELSLKPVSVLCLLNVNANRSVASNIATDWGVDIRIACDAREIDPHWKESSL
jgi:adenine/guanine phosphoribosyltransferase-like PRPP-binding protein